MASRSSLSLSSSQAIGVLLGFPREALPVAVSPSVIPSLKSRYSWTAFRVTKGRQRHVSGTGGDHVSLYHTIKPPLPRDSASMALGSRESQRTLA